MAKAPTDRDEEEDFCTTLGKIVITWNFIEVRVGSILYHTMEGVGSRAAILIVNLGNVALADALTAVAKDFPKGLQGHLKHCAKLFDAERLYRNHYVHAPIFFEKKGGRCTAFSHNITAKGGALKIHNGEISILQLLDFYERLIALREYVRAIDAHLRDEEADEGEPLTSLEKPPLPDRLELRRLRLEELLRPHQS